MRAVLEFIIEAWQDLREMFTDLWSEWWGKLILAVVLCFFVLIGLGIYSYVGSLALHEGTVTTKRHREAWMETQCISDGKDLNCHPIFHPEEWTITIDGTDENGQHNTRTVYVDQPTFERVKQGDHYKVD